MSQIELASRLQITQSYLSAIENGKGQLNPEKEELLRQVMQLDSLEDYYLNVAQPQKSQADDLEESDLLNRLLTRFHEQAHRSSPDSNHHHDHHKRIEYLEGEVQKLYERNETLFGRNERLERKLEQREEELKSCRDEVYRLRLKLASLGCNPDE